MKITCRVCRSSIPYPLLMEWNETKQRKINTKLFADRFYEVWNAGSSRTDKYFETFFFVFSFWKCNENNHKNNTMESIENYLKNNSAVKVLILQKKRLLWAFWFRWVWKCFNAYYHPSIKYFLVLFSTFPSARYSSVSPN